MFTLDPQQFNGAHYSGKCDLCSVVTCQDKENVRERDKWKTVFITNTGHCVYVVMLYGLANAPLAIQSFINDMLVGLVIRFTSINPLFSA